MWEEAQHDGIIFGDNRRPLLGLQRGGPSGGSGRRIEAGAKGEVRITEGLRCGRGGWGEREAG